MWDSVYICYLNSRIPISFSGLRWDGKWVVLNARELDGTGSGWSLMLRTENFPIFGEKFNTKKWDLECKSLGYGVNQVCSFVWKYSDPFKNPEAWQSKIKVWVLGLIIFPPPKFWPVLTNVYFWLWDLCSFVNIKFFVTISYLFFSLVMKVAGFLATPSF